MATCISVEAGTPVTLFFFLLFQGAGEHCKLFFGSREANTYFLRFREHCQKLGKTFSGIWGDQSIMHRDQGGTVPL